MEEHHERSVMAQLFHQHDQQLVQRVNALDREGGVRNPLSQIVFLATKVGLSVHLGESHEADYDRCTYRICIDARAIVECVDEVLKGETHGESS